MSRAESVTTGLSLLGCTDRRAGLGIHRTQAGRIGSSTGRGLRAEARCSTTTPAIYSVTSATDPAALRPGGATRVLGPGPARVRNHLHRPRPPARARARCTIATVPGPPERARVRCPAEDYSASSGEPASVTAPGRRSAPGPVPGRAGARPGGPVASNCAARGGSTGLHSGLRTGRTAGLLSRPRAGRQVHGCHVVGAVPGWQRHGEIAAVDRARRGSAGPPQSGVRAGARTVTQVKLASRATGRGSRGPAGGPDRPQSAGSLPSLSRGRGPCQSSRRRGTDGPRPACTRARGRDPRQSGRRWGTDGPAASTSRSIPARGQGPGDSDHAIAGAAGRGLRADGSGATGGRAGRGRTRREWVRDLVRLCFGSLYSPAGRVRAPQSRCSRCKHVQTQSNMPVDL